jgi:putative glutamine amidotransferase
MDDVLDALELDAARCAVQRELPTLGICRGQQLLNVALGGSLVQDLPSELGLTHTQPPPRTDLSHGMRVEPDSHLAAALGATSFQVNSFHHQAVRQLAPGLRPVAWSDDGVLEGFESTTHPWLLAVQFHPEDLVDFHEPSQRLFAALVDVCRQRRERRITSLASP